MEQRFIHAQVVLVTWYCGNESQGARSQDLSRIGRDLDQVPSPSLGPSSLTRQSLKIPMVTGPGHLTEVCASGWEGKSFQLWFSSAWYTVGTQ